MPYALWFLSGAIMAWLITYAWHSSLEAKREAAEKERQDKPRLGPRLRSAFVVYKIADGTEVSTSLNNVTWRSIDSGDILYLRTTDAEYQWASGRWIQCILYDNKKLEGDNP